MIVGEPPHSCKPRLKHESYGFDKAYMKIHRR